MTAIPFVAELAAVLGHRPRVLAWGQAGDEGVVGLPDRLAVSASGAWTWTAWDRIDHGQWDGESSSLRWQDANGEDHVITLTRPGRLPELFHERVSASILAQRFLRWDGGSAQIALRRNPGDPDAPVRWCVLPGEGTSIETAQADQAIAQALQDARAEWDIA
jgi:hypothetical protein